MTEKWYETEKDRIQKYIKNIEISMEQDDILFNQKLDAAQERFLASLASYTQAHEYKLSRQKSLLQDLHDTVGRIERAADSALAQTKREALRESRAKDRKIAELEKQLREAPQSAGQSRAGAGQSGQLAKASTLAIFDSILFAISNWSTAGDTAPDVELASQAILFPTVYERVMRGNEDYLIMEVPMPAAMEVVKRGRELVSHFRTVSTASLVDSEAWKTYAGEVHQWWVRDGLPLLYGARDDDWDDDVPLSLEEMKMWKEEPASRALSFPLIFDGMELVKEFSEEIRDTTGLPDFNKDTLNTRLEATF